MGDVKKKKKKNKKNQQQPVNSGESEDMETDEIQIDPNEPVYCVCRKVSYGNMVACENPDCSIEWFHFSCVNLTSEVRPLSVCFSFVLLCLFLTSLSLKMLGIVLIVLLSLKRNNDVSVIAVLYV
jgi:hypothetical protein